LTSLLTPLALDKCDAQTANSLSIFGPMTRSPQFAVTNVTATRQVISLVNNTQYSCMQFAIQMRRRVTMFEFYVRGPHWIAILFAISMFLTQPSSAYRPLFALLSVFFHFSILILISRQLGMRSLEVPRLGKTTFFTLFAFNVEGNH
jgi:hypothetical protein